MLSNNYTFMVLKYPANVSLLEAIRSDEEEIKNTNSKILELEAELAARRGGDGDEAKEKT